MTPFLALLVLQGKPPAKTFGIPQERERYRFDLKKAFYATPAARAADEARTQTDWETIVGLKGKIGDSAENLLRVLTLRDGMTALEARMSIADGAAGFLDTRREAAGSGTPRAAEEDAEVPEDFVEDELAAIPPATFDLYVAAEPKLEPYRFRLETARKGKSHRLSARDEGILSRLYPYTAEWQGAMFEALRQAKPTTATKEALGVTLLRLVGANTSTARLRGYKDGVEASLDDLDLTRKQADRLLVGLAAALPLVRGIDGARDLADRLGAPPPMSVAQGMASVRIALAPLGPEYLRELDAIYDPRNGRIDLAGGPNRAGLGTGWGFPASQPSVLYLPKYTGVYDDLDRGLAHEGGHAVHFQLMRANGVLPCYSEGPGYFFESFAEFNELLLSDSMARRATDPKRKLYYLVDFFEKATLPIALAFYPGLEFSIYDGVAKGTVATTADLDALETQALAKYVAPGMRADKVAPAWATNEAYYTHPLYNINHVLGGALAVAYYDRYKRDPKGFVPKYLALMRNGFDAPPATLLKKFLDIDLDDPKLVSNCGATIGARLPELNALMRTVQKG